MDNSEQWVLTTSLLIGTFGLACSGTTPERHPGNGDLLSPGVPLPLAEHRARTISDLHYEISLSIPPQRSAAIRGSIAARFDLSSTEQPLIFDFAQPADRVLTVAANGKATEILVENEHLVIPRSDLRAGRNEIDIGFIAGDGSLNRHDDYLYTLFVPDRARVAMPIFDQPDLKARCDLRLEVPADWRAVANGELISQQTTGDRQSLHFRLGEPISTYLLAFAAGRLELATAERDGRTMRLLHRETDSENVSRNLDTIFDLHAAALAWLEDYTAIEYPFQKFDFVALPAFQYGGMEHPGAIYYRARSLFLDESATQDDFLGRASLIAHETAHMWFGNLVTMEWFNDVWLKEVLANFMAAKIVNPSFPEVDHELRFLLAHYPRAYAVDRTAGANPIRQDLENLNQAGSLYGAIIYQKAPIVMRHLELLIGEEAFRDGIREYLDAHRYANASWSDLIEVMDRRTDRDLEAWSTTWVNEPGRPTVSTELGTAAGTITALRLQQADPMDRGRAWPQRVQLLLGYIGGREHPIPVDLRQPTHEVSEAVGLPTPDFVLANSGGVGYGNFELDTRSREALLEHLPDLASNQMRAIAWLALWDAMLEGQVAPRRLVDLATRALLEEEDELNIQRILDDLATTYWRYLPSTSRTELAPGVEALLWQLLEAAPEARLKAAYFAAYRAQALSSDAISRLRRLWAREERIAGLTLSENDMTALAQELALRGVADAENLLQTQLERLDNPDRRARFEFVRPALAADAATRDRFFDSLRDAANREQERWVLDALGFLHHPLRAATAEHLIRPSLELLEEIQRTGDIFFPLGWLQGTLDGHRSQRAAETVRGFLDQTPDLPPRLRGKLLQAADPLFRAAQILSPSDVP